MRCDDNNPGVDRDRTRRLMRIVFRAFIATGTVIALVTGAVAAGGAVAQAATRSQPRPPPPPPAPRPRPPPRQLHPRRHPAPHRFDDLRVRLDPPRPPADLLHQR